MALARSSPWRWSTLHFTHRSDYPGACEAWVRRPGELVVRDADGQVHRVVEGPLGQNRAYSSTDPDFVPPAVLPPQAVTPAYRPDGLVESRPSGWELQYDDPMWGNYRWVAALDPVELSHHVAVDDLRVDTVAGRPVWRASLRAHPGYDPRCGGNCCELIWSEAGRVCEVEDPADAYHPPGYDYPDHYDVALDVQTGIVVRCLPVGGASDAPWLENDVLAVDGDLDAVLGGR
jgi:hypothetical protein